jgi:hypothetical protein
MKFIKNLISNIKENNKRRKELNDIKEEAYQEEMKKQAKVMGKAKACIDSREKILSYQDKMKEKRKKLKEAPDVFGLKNRKQESHVEWNLINGYNG